MLHCLCVIFNRAIHPRVARGSCPETVKPLLAPYLLLFPCYIRHPKFPASTLAASAQLVQACFLWFMKSIRESG
ncbi:MAG TPA: hypothetical protein DEB17_07485 [Chlorobaculum sp.]|uniref:Uncharacterized protein n=1 Tax=Chlorobaculum tepidum (strain ATCC 49652 / DSM 12025 / NBRC 103806 / TLS) TaxID=194439 RepID=Q8KFI5_CHLTE|nr:hypothetical protein CT0341 [Chlorobaculum tepidum TLS]HBU23814.1 hypothetical protein [Chlorobaculum sp.]